MAVVAVALLGALAGAALVHDLAEHPLEVREQLLPVQGLDRHRRRWLDGSRHGTPQPAAERTEILEHGTDLPGGLALLLGRAEIRVGEGEEFVVFESDRLGGAEHQIQLGLDDPAEDPADGAMVEPHPALDLPIREAEHPHQRPEELEKALDFLFLGWLAHVEKSTALQPGTQCCKLRHTLQDKKPGTWIAFSASTPLIKIFRMSPPLSARLAAILAIGAFALPLSARAEEAAPRRLGEIRIEAMPRAEVRGSLQGSVRLRPLDGKGEEIRLLVGAEKTLSTRAPAGKAWEVDAEIPGYWAQGGILRPPAANEAAVGHLVLWPTGRLSGSLKLLDREAAFPKDLSVSFESPPATSRQQAIAKSLLSCPVDERGRWKCEVPAGALDLTFRAKGFVPRYRWGLQVAAGKDLGVGAVELRKGASLSGWVEVEGGSILPGQCIARLGLQQGPGGGSSKTEDRLRRAFVEQPVGRDGFFQLEAIPPGSYWLEVRQPGYAPARAFPLEVWDRSETSLKQPVVLKRPVAIELLPGSSPGLAGPPMEGFRRAAIGPERGGRGQARLSRPGEPGGSRPHRRASSRAFHRGGFGLSREPLRAREGFRDRRCRVSPAHARDPDPGRSRESYARSGALGGVGLVWRAIRLAERQDGVRQGRKVPGSPPSWRILADSNRRDRPEDRSSSQGGGEGGPEQSGDGGSVDSRHQGVRQDRR